MTGLVDGTFARGGAAVSDAACFRALSSAGAWAGEWPTVTDLPTTVGSAAASLAESPATADVAADVGEAEAQVDAVLPEYRRLTEGEA